MLKKLDIYERREQLCEALRSGKYKQGVTLVERAHGKHCVLQVAENITGLGMYSYELNDYYGWQYETTEKLYCLNDGSTIDCNYKPQSFEQIATFIEALP